MLRDRLKSFLRGGRPSAQEGKAAPSPTRSRFSRGSSTQETVAVRQSRGLEEFFNHVRDQSGLTILDLGGASQQNVSFITNLGHKLYSEDFLTIMDETFGLEDTVDQSNPGRIEYFLRQGLDYPEDHFDGVLIWDVLEYLEPPLLSATVERLRKIVRAQSYMLAFFHSDFRVEAVPFYNFRIMDVNSLQVAQQGMHRPTQLFNNRSLEKLFGSFEAVKFFLTKDQLREVIIKA